MKLELLSTCRCFPAIASESIPIARPGFPKAVRRMWVALRVGVEVDLAELC